MNLGELAIASIFGAVKWLGYSWVTYRLALRAFPAAVIRQRPGRMLARVLGAASVRALCGLAIGLGLMDQTNIAKEGLLAILAILLPIRVAEWWVVVWVFFEPLRHHRFGVLRSAALGTAVSYVLDVPAVFVFGLVVGPIGMC
jgi:hypothetical protein